MRKSHKIPPPPPNFPAKFPAKFPSEKTLKIFADELLQERREKNYIFYSVRNSNCNHFGAESALRTVVGLAERLLRTGGMPGGDFGGAAAGGGGPTVEEVD